MFVNITGLKFLNNDRNQPEVLAALADGFAGEEAGEPQAETLEKKRG